MRNPSSQPEIDLFCRVVDNFGDIGVCWRLARMLVADHGCPVRLIVDDMAVFAKIEPRLNAREPQQTLAGVVILRWDEAVLAQHYAAPGTCVIEAFACDLPQAVVQKMAAANLAPVWIDLEYLSAEDWVESHHARPSVHPSTGLLKTLFFPGFTPETGGLFRERTLLDERSKFGAAEQATWRQAHGLPARAPGVIDISLFCYKDAPLKTLIADLSGADRPVRLLVPGGSEAARQGAVEVCPILFLSQPDYDHLLWSCDLNFVRGEDSWVRAQWAAKPFIWQAYPQEKGVSGVKLGAFLARYLAGLEPMAAEVLADLYAMWNQGGREGQAGLRAWTDLLPLLEALDAHARDWTDRLAQQDDCATQLIRFIRSQTNHLNT